MTGSIRRYDPAKSAIFRRNRDRYGELSNFYPARMEINGLRAYHSEALYQAMRFPHRADIQQAVCAQRNPMTSKKTAHNHISLTRTDWQDVNIDIMRWTLRVKLLFNPDFGRILESTEDMPIVEHSLRDTFWGASIEKGLLVGTNALGRLLMELREHARDTSGHTLSPLDPPDIPDAFINTLRIPTLRDPFEARVVPPGGMTVNVRLTDDYDVFVGRPRGGRIKLGNPYYIGRDGDRKTVIAKFESWLRDQITAGQFTVGYIASLYGKVLGCYCAPHPCHGDVWLHYASWAHSLTAVQINAGQWSLPERLTQPPKAA